MPTMNINNAEFYYELHGKGQPLVLVTGYRAHSAAWLPILDDLAKQFQMLIFDNRGVGQTQDDNRELSIDLMANDAVALADALGLEKPHYLGWSMGGTIVQTIAAQHPDKLSKLIILASSAKWRQAAVLALKLFTQLREQGVSEELILEASLPWIFGEAFLANPENIALVKKMSAADPYPTTLANEKRQFIALNAFNGIEQLAHIKAATLVMYGIQDVLSLPYESKFMAEHIEQAELIEFNCAHMPPVEVLHEFVQAVVNFLKY